MQGAGDAARGQARQAPATHGRDHTLHDPAHPGRGRQCGAGGVRVLARARRSAAVLRVLAQAHHHTHTGARALHEVLRARYHCAQGRRGRVRSECARQGGGHKASLSQGQSYA